MRVVIDASRAADGEERFSIDIHVAEELLIAGRELPAALNTMVDGLRDALGSTKLEELEGELAALAGDLVREDNRLEELVKERTNILAGQIGRVRNAAVDLEEQSAHIDKTVDVLSRRLDVLGAPVGDALEAAERLLADARVDGKPDTTWRRVKLERGRLVEPVPFVGDAGTLLLYPEPRAVLAVNARGRSRWFTASEWDMVVQQQVAAGVSNASA